ncbi:MucR family transcriptional regulator, partial [Mesorhizobium sp. M1D.F.Ca.ET.234.01.1.1]
MTEEADNTVAVLIELTADVVSAYVSSNPVPVGELPALIGQVHAALKGTAGASISAEEPEVLKP